VIILFGSLSAVLVYSLNTLSDATKEYINRERDKLDVKLELEIESIGADSCIINVKNSGTKTIFLQSQENFQWNSIVISYQNAVRTPAPWLSGWDQRIRITIDNNDVDSALSDFPVLVYLSNSSSGRNNDDVSFVFDELQSDANRKKIVVTTSDGITQCYVEIERWDDASEQAWLWVKVPSISNTTDTDLYLYYDADHADNTDYVGDPNSTPAESVWDSDYVMVQHLQETSGTHFDSTSNGNNGTLGADVNPDADGKIDGADEFDGADGATHYISFPSSASLNTLDNMAAEAWIRTNDYTDDHQTMISFYYSSTERAYMMIDSSPEYIRIYNDINNQDGWEAVTNWHPENDTWYHIAWRIDGTDWKIYVNGEEKGTSTESLTMADLDDGFSLGVGQRDQQGDRTFNGFIDEVRISNISRSAAWIKASYESGRDDLVDFGSEESENSHWLSYIIEDYTVLEVNVTDTEVSFDPSSHSFINPGEEARISFSLPEEAPAIPEGAIVIIVFASHYGVTAQAEGVR
jgi:hypothetical protein